MNNASTVEFAIERSLRSLFVLLAIILAASVEAQAKDPIRIGALFSLSSWGAAGGQSELNGVILAKEDINAQGGIAGHPIELKIEDNQSDLKATASAFRKLIELDRVTAVIGPNWAEFTEVVVPIAEAKKTVFLSPSGYKSGLFNRTHYAFTLWPPHTATVMPLAIAIKNNVKKLAVLLNENAYLEGLYEALQLDLAGSPLAIHELMRLPAGQADYRSLISKIRASGVDGVLALLVENTDLPTFFKQAKQMALPSKIFTANGIPFDEVIQSDPSIAEGATYFDFSTPGSEKFKSRYHARFSSKPGFASAKSYDALFMLKKAIEHCKTNSELAACLRQTTLEGESGKISFDNNGVSDSRQPKPLLYTIRNGSFIQLE